jgi:hypothetical protein
LGIENIASIKSLMARASKFITDQTWKTNWVIHLSIFDIEDITEDIPRLYRSQSWGDDDYPTQVMVLFIKIAEYDEKLALDFVKYVIKQDFDLTKTGVISKDPKLLESLGLIKGGKEAEIEYPPVEIDIEKLIEVKELPHDFYYDLTEEINKAYSYNILPAVQILIRKMLENLIIDILRKKYTMKNIDLFFNTEKGRFHGFQHLLKNLTEKIDDFKAISPEFTKNFLREINSFREHGNATAHTLEINIKREEIKKDKDKLNYIIKLLTRVFQSL